MSGFESRQTLARRSFLSKFGIGLTAGGATLGGRIASAQTPSNDGGHWQPARHSLDDWLDQIPGKHRFVLDTTTPEGFGGALLDAALRHLSDRRVRGCVIDWTGLVDFYAKFGFKPYRQYVVLIKSALRND